MTAIEGGGVYAEPETIKATRADGPVTQQAHELDKALAVIDEAFGLLRARLAPVLDQRDRPEGVPGVPTDVRSPSCELGCNLEHAVGRIRRLAAAIAETTERVEL